MVELLTILAYTILITMCLLFIGALQRENSPFLGITCTLLWGGVLLLILECIIVMIYGSYLLIITCINAII